MSEEEAKKVLKNMDINENGATCNGCIFGNDTPCLRNGKDCQIIAIDTVLQLLEQKDKRIDELEKSLIDEQLKHREKIEELESELYNANCIIADYIEERNRLKNKMIGDKMEQFDDYIIYLIESYLEILEE